MEHEATAEKVTYLRPAALAATEVWLAQNNVRRWHVFHETYTFCTCTSGVAGWRYRGQEHELRGASTMLIEPGETHVNTTIHEAGDFGVTLIAPEVVDALARERGLRSAPHFRWAQVDGSALFGLFDGFYRAVASGAGILEQQSRFALCMEFLFRHCVETTAPPIVTRGQERAVVRAQAYLRERFSEAVSLDQLADEAGVSRFHLLRLFARRFGIPPHAYQIHLRIARARALLQAGVPSSLVAGEVGFADQSHFTRHFKNVMGATPRSYAQATAVSSRHRHSDGLS